MDSAFKRRWEMKYIKIDYDNKDADYTFKVNGADYHWLEYLPCINDKITLATDSEDKQMGEFFIRSNMTATEFKNKVMFYLGTTSARTFIPGRTARSPSSSATFTATRSSSPNCSMNCPRTHQRKTRKTRARTATSCWKASSIT